MQPRKMGAPDSVDFDGAGRPARSGGAQRANFGRANWSMPSSGAVQGRGNRQRRRSGGDGGRPQTMMPRGWRMATFVEAMREAGVGEGGGDTAQMTGDDAVRRRAAAAGEA